MPLNIFKSKNVKVTLSVPREESSPESFFELRDDLELKFFNGQFFCFSVSQRRSVFN